MNSHTPMSVQELFALGMKRNVPQIRPIPFGPVVNVGCGNSKIEGAINLDLPYWNAENYIIEMTAADRYNATGIKHAPGMGDIMVDCPNGIIAGIHAYHFLEHLTDPIRMIREFQRVLKPGGVINICVPHYSSQLAHQDLDHKKSFASTTWRNLLNNDFYSKDRMGWKLSIGFNMIVGIKEDNIAILTQLIKGE